MCTPQLNLLRGQWERRFCISLLFYTWDRFPNTGEFEPEDSLLPLRAKVVLGAGVWNSKVGCNVPKTRANKYKIPANRRKRSLMEAANTDASIAWTEGKWDRLWDPFAVGTNNRRFFAACEVLADHCRDALVAALLFEKIAVPCQLKACITHTKVLTDRATAAATRRTSTEPV